MPANDNVLGGAIDVGDEIDGEICAYRLRCRPERIANQCRRRALALVRHDRAAAMSQYDARIVAKTTTGPCCHAGRRPSNSAPMASRTQRACRALAPAKVNLILARHRPPRGRLPRPRDADGPDLAVRRARDPSEGGRGRRRRFVLACQRTSENVPGGVDNLAGAAALAVLARTRGATRDVAIRLTQEHPRRGRTRRRQQRRGRGAAGAAAPARPAHRARPGSPSIAARSSEPTCRSFSTCRPCVGDRHRRDSRARSHACRGSTGGRGAAPTCEHGLGLRAMPCRRSKFDIPADGSLVGRFGLRPKREVAKRGVSNDFERGVEGGRARRCAAETAASRRSVPSHGDGWQRLGRGRLFRSVARGGGCRRPRKFRSPDIGRGGAGLRASGRRSP